MKLAHRAVAIALREPFASARGVLSMVQQHVVTLSWDGLTGYGTALAAEPGELAACAGLVSDSSPHALRQTLVRLAEAGVGRAVTAALDMALHDLLGKSARQPLHRLLGLAELPVPPTAVSIGACPDAELARRGERMADWPVLKLKMTPEDDGSRAGVLRAVYPGRIWVDGNGSWKPEQAVRVAERLAGHGVELVEQPVSAGSPEDLGYVHQRSPVPVFADESCVGPDDVLGLVGRVSGINIKLTKCGGLHAARDMITLARQVGLQVMLGCKTESALGVTAMAQLGGLADHLDLDGHLLLRDDPFLGARIRGGAVQLPGLPGLGVAVTDHGEN